MKVFVFSSYCFDPSLNAVLANRQSSPWDNLAKSLASVQNIKEVTLIFDPINVLRYSVRYFLNKFKNMGQYSREYRPNPVFIFRGKQNIAGTDVKMSFINKKIVYEAITNADLIIITDLKILFKYQSVFSRIEVKKKLILNPQRSCLRTVSKHRSLFNRLFSNVRIVFPSETVKQKWRRLKFEIFENAVIPYSLYNVVAERIEVQDNSQSNVICVSGIVPGKGVHRLLKLKNTVDIYGDGPLLQQLSDRSGRHVVFKGWVDNDSLLSKLKNYKAFILLTNGETQSLAAVEALANQVPVLMTSKQGINSGCGICKNTHSIGLGASTQEIDDKITQVIESGFDKTCACLFCVSPYLSAREARLWEKFIDFN